MGLLNIFRLSNFDFSIFNFEVRFFSVLKGLSKCSRISIFHSGEILTKHGHFLNISTYFVKGFLKSHIFQGRKASSTVSSETNRAEKIIPNIFIIAMQTKLKIRMVLSTQEKSLVSSHFKIQLPSDTAVLRVLPKTPWNLPMTKQLFEDYFQSWTEFLKICQTFIKNFKL